MLSSILYVNLSGLLHFALYFHQAVVPAGYGIVFFILEDIRMLIFILKTLSVTCFA